MHWKTGWPYLCHTLAVEQRHLWNKMTDATSCGRGVGLPMLGAKFVARDISDTRSLLQRLDSKHEKKTQSQSQPSGCSTIVGEIKAARAALRAAGYSNAFMAFVQMNIRQRSQLGTWDSSCAQIINVVDDESGESRKCRTPAGKAFMRDMSLEWSSYRDTPAGKALMAEAKLNLDRRRELRQQLQDLLSKQRSTPVGESVLRSELGLGDASHPVISDAYRHACKTAPVAKWESEFDRLHEIVPPQVKTAPLKHTLKCADVGFCIGDSKDDGTWGALDLIADAFGKLFDGRCTFPKEHAVAIEHSSLIMAALFFKEGCKLTAIPFRVCIGTSVRQVVWPLCGGDSRAWALTGSDKLLDYRYKTKLHASLRVPDFVVAHMLSRMVFREANATAAQCVRFVPAKLGRKAFRKFDIVLPDGDPALEFAKDAAKSDDATQGWVMSVGPNLISIVKRKAEPGGLADLLAMANRPKRQKIKKDPDFAGVHVQMQSNS